MQIGILKPKNKGLFLLVRLWWVIDIQKNKRKKNPNTVDRVTEGGPDENSAAKSHHTVILPGGSGGFEALWSACCVTTARGNELQQRRQTGLRFSFSQTCPKKKKRSSKPEQACGRDKSLI